MASLQRGGGDHRHVHRLVTSFYAFCLRFGLDRCPESWPKVHPAVEEPSDFRDEEAARSGWVAQDSWRTADARKTATSRPDRAAGCRRPAPTTRFRVQTAKTCPSHAAAPRPRHVFVFRPPKRVRATPPPRGGDTNVRRAVSAWELCRYRRDFARMRCDFATKLRQPPPGGQSSCYLGGMTHRPDAPDPGTIRQLRAIANGQAGTLHRRQVLASGLSGSQLRDWYAAGWLDERFRWTCTFPGNDWGLQSRCWSASLSAGPDAVITGTHALALLEVVDAWGDIRVLRTEGRPRPQPGVVVRKTPSLPDADITQVAGLRVAAYPRAILDAAGLRGWKDLDRALDRGVRLRLFDGRAFDRLLNDWPDAPGCRALKAALARLDETAGLSRSELERRLIDLVRTSDLPTPLVNSIVAGMEVDLFWRFTRAIVEADGGRYHTSPADMARDIERWRALEELGYAVLRLDWYAVVYRPEETIERIRRFLRDHSAPPVPNRAAA
jgi:very-short-patch-repair endonuclease